MRRFTRTLTLLFGLLSVSMAYANDANNDQQSNSSHTASVQTYYLVRHAEKQSDGTKNPHLTEQGHQRARYLAQHLSQANISQIYSTDYHRTQETAKPLADLLGLDIESYDPSHLVAFAKSLKEKTGRILIVGHSNTTPNLTSLLSGKEIDTMNETEYDNLYQVVSIDGVNEVTRLKIQPIQ
ncbi:histidine phosphatase family protein [Ketobacter sp.]